MLVLGVNQLSLGHRLVVQELNCARMPARDLCVLHLPILTGLLERYRPAIESILLGVDWAHTVLHPHGGLLLGVINRFFQLPLQDLKVVARPHHRFQSIHCIGILQVEEALQMWSSLFPDLLPPADIGKPHVF